MRVQDLTDADFPLEIGRYTITGVLGRGGMARVFAAEAAGELGFRRPVALKFVLAEDADRDRLVTQFAQEARLAGLLAHPGLCQVFDCGLHEGVPFLAMERVDGVTLDDLVRRRGPIPPTLAVQVVAAAARALHAAHTAEHEGRALALVHRDLKPSNLMVTRAGVVKVMDFGIARADLPDRLRTATGVIKGTVVFMAPEQVRSDPLDARTDLFALGAVLWSLLTGTLLFAADSVPAAIFRIVRVEELLRDEGRLAEADALLPGLGARLAEVLREDPADRPATARIWAEHLEALLPSRRSGPRLTDWVAGAVAAEPAHEWIPAPDRTPDIDDTTQVPEAALDAETEPSPGPIATLALRTPRGWSSDERRGGTFRSAALASSNPHALLGVDLFSNAMVEYTHALLFRPHPTVPGEFHAEVARSMRVEDDGRTWVLELRDDLTWHAPRDDLRAGTFRWSAGEHPVTAHDVVFLLDLILSPDSTLRRDRFGSSLGRLEEWEAVDDHTLRVRFGDRDFAQMAALGELFPVPRFLYERGPDGRVLPPEQARVDFASHWYGPVLLGCGPYRIVSVRPERRIELERAPGWPLGGSPFDRIRFDLLPEPAAWAGRMKQGDLDFVVLPAGVYRAEVLEGPLDSPFRDGRLAEGTFDTNSWMCVALNNERPWFRDVRVRRALTSAFRARRFLVERVGGLGRRISGPMPPHSAFYDPDVRPVPFDPLEAEDLLDAAGWNDTDGDGIREKVLDGRRVRLDFTLLVVADNRLWQEIGARYAEDLARVGVRMRVRGTEMAEVIERGRTGRFDAMFCGWGGGPDPNFRQLWHSDHIDRPGGGNFARHQDPVTDRLIDEMDHEFDPRRRVELGRSLHRRLAEQAPVIFFYAARHACFWNPRLRGVAFSRFVPYENARAWWFAD